MTSVVTKPSWLESLGAFFHPRVITMLFLGFSAGLPILLIFSTLSLWLREAEVSRATVTFFSWAALGYSFKFVWAPIIDIMPLPGLTRLLGRRRAWLLLAQLAIIAAIVWMAFNDPSTGLTPLAIAAVMLGFSSATQDIVIDAYRIESAGEELQSMMSATYIAGYRIGMLVAGAGGLKLAAYLGSSRESYNYFAWQLTYICMAAVMLVGVITTLLIREPELGKRVSRKFHALSDYMRFISLFALAVAAFIAVFALTADLASALKQQLLQAAWSPHVSSFMIETLRLSVAVSAAALAGFAAVKANLVERAMLQETYIAPVTDFMQRYGKAAVVILFLIGTYKIADIVLGVLANVFYQDLGYSKDEIADISKVFGLFMTIAGGFSGGILSLRFGVMRILFIGALLMAATNLLFVLLAQMGHNIPMLIVVIAADNLGAGLAAAAFVAYLSSLTNISFTAMQFAIFTSIMTLLPKIIAGYSGSIVDSIGYESFFTLTAAMGIPVLILIVIAGKLTATKAGSQNA